MAKAGQAQDQAMDEILASIRRIIEDEDVRKSGVRVAAARIGDEDEEGASGSAGRMSRIAFDEDGRADEPAAEEPSPTPVARPMETGNVVELAIAQAIGPASDDEPLEATSMRSEAPVRRSVDMRPSASVTGRVQPPQPLMSPRSDAAVASAFQQLTTNMLAGSARTIDELVEDMLRPMLRNWLDTNLPPLVERLVREEIERVSRGRR